MTNPMEKSNHLLTPDELLDELGITTPDEIDIEAIAFHYGAIIRYRPLTGCAARIVGNGDNAIITVDSGSSNRERQRFSAAHELGHWMYDRGKISYSCQEAQFVEKWFQHDPESRANKYAGDLLLPVSLFKPMASVYRAIDFDTVKSLAKAFTTSLTSTAIRLVEHGPLPAMLVCYSDAGRQWFVRGSDVSDQLWPPQKLESGAYAYDLLKGGAGREFKGQVSAEAWFEYPIAERYNIQEHSLRTSYGDVLSILWWKDEQMLIDIDDYEERKTYRNWDE